MDRRSALRHGDQLAFPGMCCEIIRTIGRGSNAIVYEGQYRDASSPDQKHRVLVKELFPYDPAGHIWRDEHQCIRCDADGQALLALHRRSFERGNRIHLELLAQRPDQTGGNLNTYALHGTLYTLLDYSGGRSLDQAMSTGTPQTLTQVLARTRMLLLALSVMHAQGFLHLDISLDNVLLIGQGELERVMLIDYNSVHSVEELRGQTGDIFFSAKEGFTAPEVLTGMVNAISPATDLFSVTCVLFALLTGAPPTRVQLSRKAPPDISDCPLLRDTPPTVKAQVGTMLRRGLCILPDKRYRSCAAMLRDLEELERRLAGIGVTHAALWEAGRKSVQRLVRQNPSLCYVEQPNSLYPLRIQTDAQTSLPAQDWMADVIREEGQSALLVGEGGMGKSTVLLRTALTDTSRYTPAKPAVMYLPLMGIKHGEVNYILNQILLELRFDAQTRTMEEARHALIQLLNPEQKRGVRLLLLLDGLNEASGDTAGLLEELRRLSGYSALRMVIATRTAPEELPLPRAAMTPLTMGDVTEALGARGLLLPDAGEMCQLLRTPMMLSLFIQTALSGGEQVQCQTGSELIDCYLTALCRKAAVNSGCLTDYRVEAAVRLVLPAIAREISRQGHPLNDQALHGVIRQCYRVMRGKALSRAFPEWIGHSLEILGDGTRNAENWHGEMVQQTLWRQLGLLVRDEDGCYHILHQIVQEHLLMQDARNQKRIRSGKVRGMLVGFAAVLLLAFTGMYVYDACFMPVPFDAFMSETAVNVLTVQYVNCGKQYEAMLKMLSGEIMADACEQTVIDSGEPALRQGRIAYEQLRNQHSQGADVIPWSNLPLDFDSADRLLTLPETRKEVYLRYIRAYRMILDRQTQTDPADFADALTSLLDADADIAWLLEAQAVAPHVKRMSKEQRLAYDQSAYCLPELQATRSPVTSHDNRYDMMVAEEKRSTAEKKLKTMSVMYAVDKQKGE